VQRVHPLAGRVGERVGHGDQVSACDPAHRSQFDVDVKFVAGHDRAVLFEDFLGLHVGVVSDDHLFEHVAIAGHPWRRGECQRCHQVRVTQLSGGGDVPVRGVVVLHCAGVLAYLLAADQVGAVHLVVVADRDSSADDSAGAVMNVLNSSIGLFAEADQSTLAGGRRGVMGSKG